MRNAVWYKCPYQFFCGGARILKPTLYGYDTVANIRSENYLSAAKLVYPRSELFWLPYGNAAADRTLGPGCKYILQRLPALDPSAVLYR